MASRNFTPPECDYRVDGRRIVAEGARPEKITGTFMKGILDISSWSSPFQTACELLGLARDADVGDKPAVVAGRKLEPVIIEYSNKAFGDYGMFIPAAEVYGEHTGEHKDWKPDFEDPVFSGHVDGFVMGEDGESYILEIKTTTNFADWEDGVPEYYYWQVALYNHFITKQDHAYVVVGLLDRSDYADPLTTWKPSDENTLIYRIDFDEAAVEGKIEYARHWYDMYVAKGETPYYDPSNRRDVELFEHLVNIAASSESMSDLIMRDMELRRLIKEHEMEIEAMYLEKEELDKRLKDYLMCGEVPTLKTSDGQYVASLSTTRKMVLDEEKLAKDNIDVSKYKTEKITKTFTIKPVKKNKE